MLVVLLACLLGTTIAAPVQDECPRIMSEAGLSTVFAPMVTHSIHSLTLEDIRYYFKSDATEDNGIPTVNLDLTSEHRVNPNAPLVGYDEDFSTMGLKSFDLVMRNMDRTWWGITNYSVLEKVAHALHMAEMWNQAMAQYKYIGKILNPESDICACVTDIENNGVLNHLNLLAFKIRYPGITSGDANITDHYLAATNMTDPKSEDLAATNMTDPESEDLAATNMTDPESEDSLRREKREAWELQTPKKGGFSAGVRIDTGDRQVYGAYERAGFRGEAGLGADSSGAYAHGSASYTKNSYNIAASTKVSLGGASGTLDAVLTTDAGKKRGIRIQGGIGTRTSYSISPIWDWRSLKFDDIDFSLSDVELLKDVAEKLVDGDIVMTDHLDQAENWEYWKRMLKVSKDYPGHYNLGMFMFCMLN